ncbi:Mur ligase [Lactifluus subvellereus]|nr:Mur ligase [Lactifluus subvellereus]
MDLSLERIKALLSCLPPYTLPTIHIAGTNGKGSVSSFVASILQASGFTVGRFNSPHLVSVLDSILLNGEPVALDAYNRARRLVEDADSGSDVGATSFELLTATALTLFELAKLDVVVLEVGMGGRADATNAVSDDCVLVSALTAVDLDHQKFLGDTVDRIATEKAGIARKGRPFVVGPQRYPDVLVSVRTAVEEIGAELVYAEPATTRTWDEAVDGPSEPVASGPPSPSLVRTTATARAVSLSLPCFPHPINTQLPLHGDHQLDNLGVAVTIISSLLTDSSSVRRLPFQSNITPSNIAAGVRSTSWAGRLSFHDVPLSRLVPPRNGTEDRNDSLAVLVDGAHNPASASALASYLSQLLQATSVGDSDDVLNLTFIVGLSHSPPKTPSQTLLPLLSFERPTNIKIKVSAAALEFTPVDGMPWVRPVPSSEIREVILDIDREINIWIPGEGERETVGNALVWAHEEQRKHGGKGLVCLAGSLYLVADFYRILIK